MKFTLPFPPKQLNPNKRLHWAIKRKYTMAYRQECMGRVWRQLGLEALRDFRINHDGKFAFNVTFHKPDNRARDDDNVFASFKAGRDGIADAMQVDDNRFVANYRIGQNIKGGLVTVELEAI